MFYTRVKHDNWYSLRKNISFITIIFSRRTEPSEPYDACRIHGTMSLNKVEGNFHITAGKSVPLLRGHAHLSGFMDEKEYNFTHRIDQFGFGKPHAGIVHPLAGDEKIASKSKFFNSISLYQTTV